MRDKARGRLGSGESEEDSVRRVSSEHCEQESRWGADPTCRAAEATNSSLPDQSVSYKPQGEGGGNCAAHERDGENDRGGGKEKGSARGTPCPRVLVSRTASRAWSAAITTESRSVTLGNVVW